MSDHYFSIECAGVRVHRYADLPTLRVEARETANRMRHRAIIRRHDCTPNGVIVTDRIVVNPEEPAA